MGEKNPSAIHLECTRIQHRDARGSKSGGWQKEETKNPTSTTRENLKKIGASRHRPSITLIGKQGGKDFCFGEREGEGRN